MNRLTTDNPNGNTENALNLFYIKDMETWVRGGGPAPEYEDVRLLDYIRDIVKTHHLDIPDDGDEELADALFELLFDGIGTIEGIVATLNVAAWAFSSLREKLKKYEDTGLSPEEVVHGHLYEDKTTFAGFGKGNYICSECKRIVGTWSHGLKTEEMFRYCPWCGARMDGQSRGDGDGDG